MRSCSALVSLLQLRPFSASGASARRYINLDGSRILSIVLASIDIEDEDPTEILTLTLTPDLGFASATSGGGVTVITSPTLLNSSVSLTGTADALDAYLDVGRVNFRPFTSSDTDLGTIAVTLTDGVFDVDAGSIAITASDTPPAFSGPSAFDIVEDELTIAGLRVIDNKDSEGDGIVYSINPVLGDAAFFTINPVNGVLSFSSQRDFDNPENIGGDNIYRAGIRVTDSSGLFAEQLIAVTVLEAIPNQAPVVGNVFGDSSTVTALSGARNVELFDDATVTDSDSPDYSGGFLNITQTSGFATGSWFLDGTTATAGGDATIGAGETVSVGGVSIGSINATADGQGGSHLRFEFDAGATPNRIETLLQALTFNPDGGLGPRVFDLTLNDGDGTAGGGDEDTSGSFTINVKSTSPVIGNLDGDSADAEVGSKAAKAISETSSASHS